jgi:hypothetical protein
MEEILVIIIQVLFEFIFDVLLNIPFDWPSKNRTTPEPDSIWPSCFLWFMGASFLGWVSLLFFKHTLITSPALRVANLALAPLVSATLSKAIATRRAEKNLFIFPRNHYWQAFWFTLGFTMVRFAYATHT